MSRPSIMFDTARALAELTAAYLDLDDADLSADDVRMAVTVSAAQVFATLAIAEALHGVVYVANANAV